MPIYTIISEKIAAKYTLSTPKNEPLPKLGGGQKCVLGHLDDNKILVDGKIIDKPASKITLAGTKLENLPNPTIVTIIGNGTTFWRTITDGVYEFSIDVPGKYVVKCESKVELPIEFKVVI